MKRMKRRRLTVIAEGATRYSEKISNMLTWFKVNHQYNVPTIYQRVSRTSIFE